MCEEPSISESVHVQASYSSRGVCSRRKAPEPLRGGELIVLNSGLCSACRSRKGSVKHWELQVSSVLIHLVRTSSATPVFCPPPSEAHGCMCSLDEGDTTEHPASRSSHSFKCRHIHSQEGASLCDTRFIFRAARLAACSSVGGMSGASKGAWRSGVAFSSCILKLHSQVQSGRR